MKRLIALLISALAVSAEPVTLMWDASDTPGVTYTIYASKSTDVISTATIITNAGTNLTVTIDVPVGMWFFVATAKLDDLESEPSNMVSYKARPGAPKNNRKK